MFCNDNKKIEEVEPKIKGKVSLIENSKERLSANKRIKIDVNINKNPYDFCYLEFSAFPRKLEENVFGMAIGYRLSHSEKISTDYSFHFMHDFYKDIIICAKANHLMYAFDKKEGFSPYVGFGMIVGLGPAIVRKSEDRIYNLTSDDFQKEYLPFVNGELVMGCEYELGMSRQFFELTYYAGSNTLQMSIGLGF